MAGKLPSPRPARTGIVERIKRWARLTRDEVAVLAVAMRDPRCPWFARAFVGLVVLYALSPIDLIPDFIPVIGFLDEAILLPIAILIARRLVPKQVLADARVQVEGRPPKSRWGAVLIIAIWLGAAVAAGYWLVGTAS